MNAFNWRRPSEPLNDIKTIFHTGSGRGRPMRPVEQLDMDGRTVQHFPSIRAASTRTRIADSNIVRALSGMRQSAGGYRWRYLSAAEQVLSDKFGGAYSKAVPNSETRDASCN